MKKHIYELENEQLHFKHDYILEYWLEKNFIRCHYVIKRCQNQWYWNETTNISRKRKREIPHKSIARLSNWCIISYWYVIFWRNSNLWSFFKQKATFANILSYCIRFYPLNNFYSEIVRKLDFEWFIIEYSRFYLKGFNHKMLIILYRLNFCISSYCPF